MSQIKKQFYIQEIFLEENGRCVYTASNMEWKLRDTAPEADLITLDATNTRPLRFHGCSIAFGKTLFRHRPYLQVCEFGAPYDRYYFDSPLQLRIEYTSAVGLSLSDIAKHASAEDAIAYIKQ